MSAIYIALQNYEKIPHCCIIYNNRLGRGKTATNYHFIDIEKQERETYRWPQINKYQVIVTATRNQFISMFS
jgi:hypothetical protein